MRIPRLFQPGPLDSGRLVELDEAVFVHAVRVLRLKPGALLTLFDGGGGEYDAVLETVERRTATVRLGRFRALDCESPLQITLVQGVSRGERMDYALQKAVELGATAIQPVLCERSPPREPDRLDKRWRHWQGVVISACEQCGRNRLPALGKTLKLTDWLARSDRPEQGLMLDPDAATGLAALPRPGGALSLLVGPEGGLSRQEIAAAGDLTGIRLGPRILRTETAGAAALAALQTLWGDLG